MTTEEAKRDYKSVVEEIRRGRFILSRDPGEAPPLPTNPTEKMVRSILGDGGHLEHHVLSDTKGGASRPWYVSPEVWSDFVREERAYLRELPRLLTSAEYRGKWVAFHNERPADADENFDVLAARFRQERGDVSVYIGPVAIREDQQLSMDLGGHGELRASREQ